MLTQEKDGGIIQGYALEDGTVVAVPAYEYVEWDGHGYIVTAKESEAETENGSSIAEIKNDGEYSSKDEVAEYIHLYNKLPKNFITKKEAKELGWVSSKGNLWEVAPGKSIGGDRFGNREGNLPTGKGLKYYECDINYNGGRRGAERIVYSNKGNIYYSDDHYRSFEKLY